MRVVGLAVGRAETGDELGRDIGGDQLWRGEVMPRLGRRGGRDGDRDGDGEGEEGRKEREGRKRKERRQRGACGPDPGERGATVNGDGSFRRPLDRPCARAGPARRRAQAEQSDGLVMAGGDVLEAMSRWWRLQRPSYLGAPSSWPRRQTQTQPPLHMSRCQARHAAAGRVTLNAPETAPPRTAGPRCQLDRAGRHCLGAEHNLKVTAHPADSPPLKRSN